MASLIETPRSYQRRSEFYHQLSMLQQAGVGIRDSLHQINPHSRQEAEEIRGTLDQMGSGATFSESLSGRTRWLPDFDRLMIEAGETSGQLDQTLRILSEHYEHRSSLIRQVLLKLAYPVLLIHFIILMPAIIGFGQALVSTGGASLFSAFAPSLATLAASYALVFGIIYLGQANRGYAVRSFLEKIWHKIPGFGNALKEIKLARLAFSLHALLNAGVTVREAWQNAGNSSGSPWLATLVGGLIPKIDAGLTPAEVVRTEPEFPLIFRDLYSTGETSGQLDDSLPRLAKHFQENGVRHLVTSSAIATAVVYGVVAIAVAFIVISFWMNHYGSIMNMN